MPNLEANICLLYKSGPGSNIEVRPIDHAHAFSFFVATQNGTGVKLHVLG